jgi:CRP-like cAMP-binding protein
LSKQQSPRVTTANHILSRLSREEYALLHPHLQPVDLPVRTQLETRNKRVESAYFIDSGFASVVGYGAGNLGIEIGLIGREGASALSIVLCSDDRAAHDIYMQSNGAGFSIRAADLRAAIAKSTSLHHSLLRYAHTFLLQTAGTAIANGRSKIEERLARWLLMAADRTGNNLYLTHEFLSLMLGVHRPGVTNAVQVLEREKLIGTRRGVITILNRDALVKRTRGTYAAVGD